MYFENSHNWAPNLEEGVLMARLALDRSFGVQKTPKNQPIGEFMPK